MKSIKRKFFSTSHLKDDLNRRIKCWMSKLFLYKIEEVYSRRYQVPATGLSHLDWSSTECHL